MLIPNQIMLFESPDDEAVAEAGGTHFADIDGRRSFSTTYYAELLADLGAALVVSFDEVPAGAADAPRAAFAAAGIDYCALEDLCGGGASRLSLQTLDRFVSLVAGCPGLVAVQCRDDFHSGITATCLAALLLRQRSFPATADALAWMRMVCPVQLAQAVDLGLLEGQRPDPAAWKLRRDRSVSLVARPVSGGGSGAQLLADLADALASIEEDPAAGLAVSESESAAEAASAASTPFSRARSSIAPPEASLPAASRPSASFFGRTFSTSSPNLIAWTGPESDDAESWSAI
jgi:hypothetical protein